MKKEKPILKVKGLRTPRGIIWLRGFIHGKMMTGELDPETEVITSPYITGQTKRFISACIVRREKAEKILSGYWVNANQLLLQLRAISDKLTDCETYVADADKSSQERAKERAANRRNLLIEEQEMILRSLAEIKNRCKTEYECARNQMAATAEALLSVFSCYGHGLILEPIAPENLPTLTYDDCARQILFAHENTWKAVLSVLEEVR